MFFWAHYHGAPTVPSLNPARQVALRWSGANGMHQHINKPSRTHVCILYIYICMRVCVCFYWFYCYTYCRYTITINHMYEYETSWNIMKLFILKNCEDPILERALSLQLAITTHEISEVKRFLKGYQLSHVVPMGCQLHRKIHGKFMECEWSMIWRKLTDWEDLIGSHRISEVPNMFCMANFNSAGDCCHLGHPPFSQSMMDNSDLVQHFAFTTATLW